MAFKDEVGSLDRIANAVETISGGKEIPNPTPSDKDKVLSVNAQGKYALATPSGGGGGMLVISETVEDNIGTLNKTFGEIKEAVFTNHMVPVMILHNADMNIDIFSPFYSIVSTGAEGGNVVSLVGEGAELRLRNYVADTDSDYPTTQY